MKRSCRIDRIGKYSLREVLGHGGMGSVYRAVDTESGQAVALKILNPASPLAGVLDNRKLRDLFYAEAQVLARLEHQNIVQLLDFDVHNTTPYYTMEFFCTNLAMLIGERLPVEERTRPVPPDKAVGYVLQVLAGLKCLHRAAVIHRDIKPHNMMLTPGDRIKICDFGLARTGEDHLLKFEGINIGSPYYSAPEQIRTPGAADARSDLYSTGVLLYRMLTGELPSMKDFMLSRVNPLYTEAWDAFFAKALNWRPERRYQNAEEMATDLGSLGLRPGKTRPTSCPDDAHLAHGKRISLRHEPVRAAGAKARKLFQANDLWQPLTPVSNCFIHGEKGTFADKATGLTWQKAPSGSPMDRNGADEYIALLNRTCLAGIDSWRLPTVNELLSLVGPAAQDSIAAHSGGTAADWFWSCDRRSPETSWFVNSCLGFAGWQYDYCPCSVRAVSSGTGSAHPTPPLPGGNRRQPVQG